MAKEETDITNRIMLDESQHGTILFKNIRGMFLTLDGKYKIKAGLQCKGSSDLIGYTPVKITEDMVGSVFSVFTAIEVKTETGGIRQDQLDFIDRVKARGGLAGIARNSDDARKIVVDMSHIVRYNTKKGE